MTMQVAEGGLRRLLIAIALLLTTVHGTQWSLNLLSSSAKGPTLNLGLADILLLAAFCVWAADRLRRRDWSWPPVGTALFGVAWLILSLIPGLKGPAREGITTLPAGLVKVVQFAEYFVAGYIVLREAFLRETARKWAIWLLGLAALVSLIAAAFQYADSGLTVVQVRGAGFANRNTFGSFLALTLPLIFGTTLFAGPAWMLAGASVLVAGGLCLSLSGGAFAAMVVGLLTASFMRGRVPFALTAVLLLLGCVLVLPRLPRKNSAVLLDSVLLYRDGDPHAVFRVQDGTDPLETAADRLIAKRAELDRKVRDREPVSYDDVPSEMDYSWKWSQRYKECQAALKMISRSPLFGVGWGSYQANVNRHYERMPKYPKNLLEPDTLCGYAVWGASAGVPFLLIMLALILRAARSVVEALVRCDDGLNRGLAAGIAGSLAAWAIVSLFGDPLVRGLGLTTALIFAMAAALSQVAVSHKARVTSDPAAGQAT